MTLSSLLRLLPLILAAGLAVTLFVFVLRRRSSPGAASLLGLSLTLILWAAADGIYWFGDLALLRFWLSVTYLTAALASYSLLTFTLEYTDRGHWLTWWSAGLLCIEPVANQIFFWTGWFGIFQLSPQTVPYHPILVSGQGGLINASYCIVILLISIVFLIDTIVHSPRPYRLQSGTVLVGGFFALLAGLLHLTRLAPPPGFDISLTAFTLTCLACIIAIGRFHLLDIIPIARNIVVERMDDGWMVLDNQDRVVDINPAVEEVLGIPRDKLFGLPAGNIISDWPNLMKRSGDSREIDIKGSINTRNGWRYLNIRVSPLTGRKGHRIGQVIVWRDITERRKEDEARQRARDEMFVLLHAISGAASRALTLEDFLAETIYQIVYSFQCQSSVIFLLEEGEEGPEKHKLTLAAHHGLPVWGVDSMNSIPEAYEMVSWVLKHREPLLIPDISTDPRIPWSMQQGGRLSLLIVPIAVEEELLGVIGLARKKGPFFSSDEVARLGAVADEVATFISSNRQRQIVIAMSERQRLVRDLHDSVTQKLYGLVTLTEAAQAGLEAGSAEMSTQVLSRIGENARQALKEMRLFLHELQPVDLEREGLVAVLHQRLAAVEGRADVKARLLADDNVSLPFEKEVALYYIAQEALNNVLRHAQAKSVTVRIKKRKTGVLLEVEDDGCGFHPQKSDQGGMGLRNMQERADQVGGRFKIISSPGKGTKVAVTVSAGKKQTTQAQIKG